MNAVNIFGEDYQSQINTYLGNGKPTQQKSLATVTSFLRAVEVDQHISDKVIELLTEIASVKPGVELLERITLFSSQDGLKISFGKEPLFNDFSKSLIIDPKYKHNYISINERNEKTLVKGPLSAVLFHELVHVLHAYEGSSSDGKTQRVASDLLAEMDNEEEQLTISGISAIKLDDSESDTTSTNIASFLSENTFLIAMGYPIRLNHQGGEYSLQKMAELGALATLREQLEKHPELLNSTEHCELAESSMSLLSRAAYFNRPKVVDFLIKEGVGLADEIGGPILAAIKNNHITLAIDLLDRGIASSIQDHEGRTALNFVQSRRSWRFATPHRELVDKLESLHLKSASNP